MGELMQDAAAKRPRLAALLQKRGLDGQRITCRCLVAEGQATQLTPRCSNISATKPTWVLLGFVLGKTSTTVQHNSILLLPIPSVAWFQHRPLTLMRYRSEEQKDGFN